MYVYYLRVSILVLYIGPLIIGPHINIISGFSNQEHSSMIVYSFIRSFVRSFVRSLAHSLILASIRTNSLVL
jgi:short-subunit dehydrogenase